jgi:hypothetical protein
VLPFIFLLLSCAFHSLPSLLFLLIPHFYLCFLLLSSFYLLLFDKLLNFHIYLLFIYFYFSLLIFHFLPHIQTFFLLTSSTFCLTLSPNINIRCLQNTVHYKKQRAVLGLLIPSPAKYEGEEKLASLSPFAFTGVPKYETLS